MLGMCAYCIGLVLSAISAGQPEPDHFTPGRVFITESAAEGCYALVPVENIREIDLRAAESWVFAPSGAGLCSPNGLAFTPDGKRLRVLNLGDDNVEDFDGAAIGTYKYFWSDGIYAPWGANALGFDRLGNFFVSRHGNAAVLCFRHDQRPGVQFGPSGATGALVVGAKGDVFVASGIPFVVRIRADETWDYFDSYGSSGTQCIAMDTGGDLFVGALSGRTTDGIYAYDGADAGTRRRLCPLEFLSTASGRFAMTVSPNERELYVVDMFHLWAVDVNTGVHRMLLELPERGGPIPMVSGIGIAVYWPPALPGFIAGDVNCDGTVNQFDVFPFIAALTSRDGYDQQYPECLIWRADVNEDGTVNPFDIQPFVELLGTP